MNTQLGVNKEDIIILLKLVRIIPTSGFAGSFSTLISLFLLLPLSVAHAVTVCPSGCDFTSIGAALNDVASAGQDVIVDPGTYTEGNLSVSNRTLQSSSPLSPESTIIDATGVNEAVISNASNATIRGLTITGGNQIGAPGGGIRISGGTVILQDLIIENNVSDFAGGGVGTNTGSSIVEMSNVVIRGNTATTLGGGIYWPVDGAITISNSSVENNTVLGGSIPVTATGGGIFKGDFSTMLIENTNIEGNTLQASQRNFGAGIRTSANSTQLLNVSVSNNTAMAASTISQGGGVYFVATGGRQLDIGGGSISGNSAGSNGGGVFCNQSILGTLSLNQGTVSGNAPDDISGCFAPAVASGETPADNEQSGTDADPVNTFSGDLFNQFFADINLGGPMPLSFSRYYSSALLAANVSSTMGNNWRHNFEWTLTRISNEIDIVDHHGRLIEFIQSGVDWNLAGKTDVVYQLAEAAGQFTLLDPHDQNLYTFNSSGQLITISDGKGNVHTLAYNSSNRLTQVADGLGRSLTLSYDLNGQLASVSDGTRAVTFIYVATDLTSVTDTNGNVTVFAYDPGSLMTSMTRPESNTPFTQTWNGSGQVDSQTDSSGNTTTFSYAGLDTTMTDPLTNTRVHTHTSTGEFSNRQDQAGLSFSMGSDASGRRNSLTDRLGDTTSLNHDVISGELLDVTNADGSSFSYAYTPRALQGVNFFDLTSVTHANASTETLVYDALGNPTSHTNELGDTTLGAFNANGQPLNTTNVAGGITTNTYNADATLATTSDPAGNTTTFGYDALKRLNLLTFADGSTRSLSYDNADNLLTSTNENGNTFTLTYDANDNLSTTQDALGNSSSLSYDGNDRLLSWTNPLAGISSRSYNTLGKPTTLTDANGNTTAFAYNALSQLTSITDPGSNIWSLAYDAEAILTSISDPLSNTVTFLSDSMGRITQTTSPLGNISSQTYDVMGQIASTTDELGNTTTLARDARGLLTDISLPGGVISASYSRNAFGEVTSITDPAGNAWNRSYDNTGRLTSSTDPLGNIRTIVYDNRNRPTTITFPDGLGTQTPGYDPVGNVTSSSYSDGSAFNFSYDANNRLTSADGITLGYDANNRVINCNGITITRDAGGRIETMTLAAGKAITYSYDANDRVTQITDWDGGITSFSYDSAGKLIARVRPNGINNTSTYDNDSRLTSLSEGLVSTIDLTRDAKGQITSAVRNVPQAASATTLGTNSNTYDVASQLTNGSYDGMGRLTSTGSNSYSWNLASQLTGLTHASGTQSSTYDAVGNRLSRTINTDTRSYTWNFALGLASISIEQQAGIDLRYFVHTPGGALLYSIDAASNARNFYHYDEMGNTIFITDDAGTVIASYAYTPYGKLIAETGSIDNAFTWQGQFGVMTEGENIYYIRARYYDANTARFISRDLLSSIDPKAINPYQYALSNPLKFVDVSGKEAQALEPLQDIFNRTTLRRPSFGYVVLDMDKFDRIYFDGAGAAIEEAERMESLKNATINVPKPVEKVKLNELESFFVLLGVPLDVAIDVTSDRPEESQSIDFELELDAHFLREANLLHLQDNLEKARHKLSKARKALAIGSGSNFDDNFQKVRDARAALKNAENAFEDAGGVESVVPQLGECVVVC